MADLYGLSLILPRGADLTYSYSQQVAFTQLLGTAYVYFPEAPFYETPLVIFGTLSTDATAGNRTVILETFDEDDQFIYKIPAATTQPPSSIYQYTYAADFSAFSTNTSQTSCAPIPLIPLLPGWHMEVTVSSAGASDVWTVPPYMTVLRVPSGPVTSQAAPAVPTTPPPILV